MRRRGRPIIAWRVDQGPAVLPPAGQPFFARGEPVEPVVYQDEAVRYARQTDRGATVSMWQGIRRRLRGQARPLPTPSREVMERLMSQIEQASGEAR